MAQLIDLHQWGIPGPLLYHPISALIMEINGGHKAHAAAQDPAQMVDVQIEHFLESALDETGSTFPHPFLRWSVLILHTNLA